MPLNTNCNSNTFPNNVNIAYNTTSQEWIYTVVANTNNCGNGKTIILSCVNGAWSLTGTYIEGPTILNINTCNPFKLSFETYLNVTNTPEVTLNFTPSNSTWPASP